MKKKLFIVTAFVCLMAMALVGCGGDTTKTTEANGDVTTTGSSSNTGGKTYNLSFSIHDPATSAKTAFYEDLAAKTKEATDGAVNITVYSAGSLLGQGEVMEGVINDVADMGWLCTTSFPGQFPLNEVVQLPMIAKDGVQASMVLNKLYETNEDLQAEMSNYKVFHMYTTPCMLICTNEPVYSPDDLAGKTLRATAGVPTEILKIWGGSPVVMGPGDIYEALNKNTIQGAIFEWSGIGSFNLAEVIKYYTEVSITCNVYYAVMNLDVWNSLPAEYQEIIDSIWSGEDVSMQGAQIFADDYNASRQDGIDNYGATIITPNDEQLAKFQSGADQYIADWVKTNSANGFDAQAYLDEAKALFAEN